MEIYKQFVQNKHKQHISISIIGLYCFCLLTLVFNACDADTNIDEVTIVSGHIVHTSDYCGGPPPPEELLEELATEKPLTNTTFYVRSGTSNDVTAPVITEFTTNDDGAFAILAADGDYVAVTAAKLNAYTDPFWGNTPECQMWLATPDLVFSINGTYTPDTLLMHISCNGCTPPPPIME